jgi:hypothetical protein
MALPRFSFSGGATEFFQPNQALFRTTFTPSDKLQSDTYQAEAKAYQDAVEKYNEAIKVNPEVAPALPTPISFTQKDFDQFGVDASRRAQQLQNAKQNTFNAISNPSGFSQHYGIGSLSFGDGGEVSLTSRIAKLLDRGREYLNVNTPALNMLFKDPGAAAVGATTPVEETSIPIGDVLLGGPAREVTKWSEGNYPFEAPPEDFQGLAGSFPYGSVPQVKQGRLGDLAATVALPFDVAGIANPVVGAAVRGTRALAKEIVPMAAERLASMTPKFAMMPENTVLSAATSRVQAPVSEEGFYSALEEAALNLKRKKGTGESFQNDLLKQPNVTADELEWTGLKDFLKEKKSVTDKDIQDYLTDNRVDVKEVALGDEQPFDKNKLLQLEYEYNNLKQHPIDDPSFGQEKYDELITLLNIRDQSTVGNLYERAEEVTKKAQMAQRMGDQSSAERKFRYADLLTARAGKLAFEGLGPSNPTQYANYTLQGGENYREFLFTMPSKTGERGYNSSHWNYENVLAHMRVNDRVDTDGKKVLLIEELQSDWHQAGRGAPDDKGQYTNPEYITDFKRKRAAEKEYQDLREEIIYAEEEFVSNWDKKYPRPTTANYNERKNGLAKLLNPLNEKLLELKNKLNSYGTVPDAPMKDDWYHLPLKRALKIAVDEGYDRIALTNSSRQIDRYEYLPPHRTSSPEDLRGNLDSIIVRNRVDGLYITVNKKNGSLDPDYEGTQFMAEDKDLDKLFGKETANKIRENIGKPTLEGFIPKFHLFATEENGLTIGGEGMKKYYDEVYPDSLKKLSKKYDAKLGNTRIEIGDGSGGRIEEPVTYLEITPKMREALSGDRGQAMFKEGGAVGAGIASLRPSETSMGLAPYGVRHSGEGLKGKGYFGEIQSPSGQSVTEYSLYDEDIGEYPSIVPTLTAEELQDTIRRSSQGEHPSVEVIMKARMYAKDRLSDGKSTFSGPTELRFPVPSNTDDDMIRRIDAYLEKNRP